MHVSVIVVHVLLPGDDVTVYDTAAPFPDGDSTHCTATARLEAVATSELGEHGAITGASEVARRRFGVRYASACAAYVIAPHVARIFNQFHAAVGPVAKFVGPVESVCKKRATVPARNGAAIDVPDWTAYVFVTLLR